MRCSLGFIDIGRCCNRMRLGAFVGLAEVETVGRNVVWPSRAAPFVCIGAGLIGGATSPPGQRMRSVPAADDGGFSCQSAGIRSRIRARSRERLPARSVFDQLSMSTRYWTSCAETSEIAVPCFASATGPADAVDVVFRCVWQLEVDDVRQFVNVEAARGDIGGDKHQRAAVLNASSAFRRSSWLLSP